MFLAKNSVVVHFTDFRTKETRKRSHEDFCDCVGSVPFPPEQLTAARLKLLWTGKLPKVPSRLFV